jgi:hypothetical protein
MSDDSSVVGMMRVPEDAALVVEAVNAYLARMERETHG